MSHGTSMSFYTTFKGFDLLVIVGSAGAFHGILDIVKSLPEDFPIPVIIAQHHSSIHPYYYEELFQGHTRLRIRESVHGMALEGGSIYFPPAGYHISAKKDKTLVLKKRQTEELYCPSADQLLHSISVTDIRTLAVVLSGSGEDGSKNLKSFKRNGNCLIVQNRTSSKRYEMPAAAVSTGVADFVMHSKFIPNTIISLVMLPAVARTFQQSRSHGLGA
jgi:two-component system, chemotaxis family, protein-glutamate methylesterase/glutaminase